MQIYERHAESAYFASVFDVAKKFLPVQAVCLANPSPQGVDLTRYRRIGEEVTTLVGFEPGKYYRIAVVRPKYGQIDSTEPVERGKGVVIAPLPKFPIYKGVPDSSLLSEIVLQKYEYHMPFYRQIKVMAHMGMTGLKEATLVGWYKRTMELLRPLLMIKTVCWKLWIKL